ncbi:MAG: hypothetical protein ACREBR_03850 [bacterium]
MSLKFCCKKVLLCFFTGSENASLSTSSTDEIIAAHRKHFCAPSDSVKFRIETTKMRKVTRTAILSTTSTTMRWKLRRMLDEQNYIVVVSVVI